MTAPPDTHAAFAEVLQLTAALTDRALDAQIRGEPIPMDQVQALRKAAELLRDHSVPWPPMLTQVLHDLPAPSDPEPREAEARTADDLDVGGLTRFFAGLRKDRGKA